MYQQPRTLDDSTSMLEQIRADPSRQLALELMSEIDAMEAEILSDKDAVSTGRTLVQDRKISVIGAARSIVSLAMKC